MKHLLCFDSAGFNLVWPPLGVVLWVWRWLMVRLFLCLPSSAPCPAACTLWWLCSTPSPGNTPSSLCCQGPCWTSSAVPLPSWWGCCPAHCLNLKSYLLKRWVHYLWASFDSLLPSLWSESLFSLIEACVFESWILLSWLKIQNNTDSQ